MKPRELAVSGGQWAAAGNPLHGRFDESPDVLGADPATGAAPLNLVDIDAEIAGQPPDRRGGRSNPFTAPY